MDLPEIDPRQTILFVGAGVSMKLGLPSWSSLLGEIGEELGFDPDIFRSSGSPLALAEYYEIQKKSLADLAKKLDDKWHSESVAIGDSKLHKAIAELGFARIYTTNFDRWLEKAFEYHKRRCRKIIRVDDLRDRDPDVTEIIKFHGDFDDPKTLVLTESNYFDRLNFESHLDIMLRADALHRPILFIGYSLSDLNIRYLLHKLGKVWGEPEVNAGRRRSYIYMARPNPVEEALFDRWHITPIKDEGTNDDGLVNFLNGLSSASR